MVFAEVLAQNSFVLACQLRSSMMIIRHTDLSTSEAYYIIVGRTETPVAMEKLQTKWARNGQRGKVNIPLSHRNEDISM